MTVQERSVLERTLAERIRDASQRLSTEFRGYFSPQTVERCASEQLQSYKEAPVLDFVPLFVERFTRQQLMSSSSSRPIARIRPIRLVFACVHNAGRSQMAAAFAALLGGENVVAQSGGSSPAERINPVAAEAMAEAGIDIYSAKPAPLQDSIVEATDVVVSMGCGDACPVFPGKLYFDWEVEDPAGKSLEEVRLIRDDIRNRVAALLERLEVP